MYKMMIIINFYFQNKCQKFQHHKNRTDPKLTLNTQSLIPIPYQCKAILEHQVQNQMRISWD